MKKVLNLTLAIILLAAIVSVIGRSFNTSETMDTNSYPMFVDSTEHLITYDITDCRIDLACGQIPDTTDEQVIFCAAAAFTGKCLDYFEHTNILGQHVSNGVLYDGYTENKDGVPFDGGTAENYSLTIGSKTFIPGFEDAMIGMEKGVRAYEL